MRFLLITRLLWEGWARKPVNHTSWVAVVTPTDCAKSVRNRCVIEVFGGVFVLLGLLFGFFCACRGFCHRTQSGPFFSSELATQSQSRMYLIILIILICINEITVAT